MGLPQGVDLGYGPQHPIYTATGKSHKNQAEEEAKRRNLGE
jgi:hypothetical protein